MSDKAMEVALVRYQIISPYLAADPPRGQRAALRRQLAARVWTDHEGEPLTVSAETIRAWIRHYRKAGLEGLKPKPRPKRGVQVLSPEEQELVCKLKREVPERSLERIIEIAEGLALVPVGKLRRSTVHRVLQAHGISARKARVPDRHDLDRFEADAPGDLWQSDLLKGPWLPDPARPGKVRRAQLYAFLDDHSRLVLDGRFHFSEAQPHLELVFRQALRKWGLPKRVYYDNAGVYRSKHMKQVVAELGIHRVVFTQPYRPMGHGKIEALNRLIRASFIAELKASSITTLDGLNEAFRAWTRRYNATVHSETGAAPLARYRAALDSFRFAEEEALRRAFLWREHRSADKAGVLSLMGRRYQVSARLARRRLELRFDPEHLEELEVWLDGAFMERARPLQIHANRRPKAPAVPPVEVEPTADWLAHLVATQREAQPEPSPRLLAEQARRRREEADEAVLELLRRELDAGALDEQAARDWLQRFGPFERGPFELALMARFALGEPRDTHITELLDALLETLR